MTENMSDNSPTKKRKANDGQATVPDGGGGSGGLFSSWLDYFSGRRDGTTPTASSTTCGGENLTQKMDAMMQMMSRMEKRQLASMGSLEKRCKNLEAECSKLEHMLEAKCNSLEHKLKTKMEQDGSKFEKHNEYNSMLLKNLHWKYSTPVHPAEYWEDYGYNEDEARYLAANSDCLKDFTEKMRRGEFPQAHSDGTKGINLNWGEGGPILDDDAGDKMRPHLIEFADALKQFTPAFGMLPDGCETFFSLENIQLPAGNVAWQLKDALMGKPFQTLSFVNKVGVEYDETMSVDKIMDIIDSNKHLRKLTMGNNRILPGQMEKLCSAVRRGSIVTLDLKNCFGNGVGNDMMTTLLTSCGSKLKRLGLPSNGIASVEIALLADFLATNPPLKMLDVSNNGLSGDCVDLLANALRSNTSLRILDIRGNTIRDGGKESLRLVMHNDSSLNSIADSNHSCSVAGVGFHSWNMTGFWKNGAWHEAPASFNRARKIYKLLSMRNKSTSMSNVQHFDDIDIKILPLMLKTVQRYAIEVYSYDDVEALSIVYEVMRKWDKVFPLYIKE